MSFAELMDTELNKKETRRVLTAIEIARMFHVAGPNTRDCMLLKCMYFLGLRNSEVQNLRIEDIDFKSEKVRVGRGRKTRYAAIPNGFEKELETFIRDKKGYVFSGRSNGLLSDRHIRRIVKSHACRAGLQKCEEIHPHTLRHSYVSEMSETRSSL